MTKPSSPARSDAVVRADIERLRQWLEKQPHLPGGIEDAELEAFVRGTKTLEIAKKKLDGYYTVRARTPQLFDFKNRDPLEPEFQEASKAMTMYFLPKATPEGYRVFIMRVGPDLKTFNHQQKIARTLMMIELAMVTWPDMAGMIICYDMKYAPANLINRLSLSLTGVALHWTQSAIPMKVKKALFINAPSFISTIVNTIGKPFLSNKLYQRITISMDDTETLKKFIPEEMLPSDYDGDEKSAELLNEYWLDLLVKKRDWFMKTSKQVVDEKKRPPDNTNTYGIEGTFRSLSLD